MIHFRILIFVEFFFVKTGFFSSISIVIICALFLSACSAGRSNLQAFHLYQLSNVEGLVSAVSHGQLSSNVSFRWGAIVAAFVFV